MKYRRMIALGAVMALPFIAMAGGVKSEEAQAVSYPYYEGAYASGAIVKENECPVIVEKESLTLNISSLPSVTDKDSLAYCAGEAEINYLFYNPGDTAYKMTLLSPYDMIPSYMDGAVETVSFSAFINQNSVNGNIRHTYAKKDFQIHDDSERVREEKRTGFSSPDSLVTKYTYTVYTPDTEDGYSLRLSFPVNSRKSHVYFERDNGILLRLENGNTHFRIKLDAGSRKNEVSFYIAGEPVGVRSASLFHGKTQVDYEVEPPEITTLTFEELAMKDYSASSGVGKIDWYNAFFDMLEDKADANGYVFGVTLRPERFMRWYEYEVEIPPKGYAENTVKVPVYPTIVGEKNPRYEYGFLLSAAEKWSSVKEVEIHINTPYYLTHSSLDFPEPETKEGMYTYSLTRTYLPQGDLTFVLAGEENASTDFDSIDNKKFSAPFWNWATITLFVFAGVAAGAAVALFISLRVKKKK